MIFNSWVYACFLLATVGLYWTVPVRWRSGLLTCGGAVFYAYWYPWHLALIGAAILAVFVVSRLVAPERGAGRGRWAALGIAGCVGMLAYFKYSGFALDLVRPLLATGGIALPAPQPRPPLGISFFVFEFVHYLVEVYRGSFAPARLGDFTLFILFFPTLICGPIKRFGDFAPQEHTGGRPSAVDVHAGLERILFGLAKKTLIADALSPFCSGSFRFPLLISHPMLWLAVYGYALQIYADFSGYSDIAIGSARLLGYRVPENFDWPYLQPNVARFWRCWHMSLTSWITDYVYIPLGGSRRGEGRAAWNRLVSMTLCGLWHGAALHFAAWGLYHGLALNLYRLWERWRPRLPGVGLLPAPAARALATVATFHVVCLGWVLFVCDFKLAAVIFARLFFLR